MNSSGNCQQTYFNITLVFQVSSSMLFLKITSAKSSKLSWTQRLTSKTKLFGPNQQNSRCFRFRRS